MASHDFEKWFSAAVASNGVKYVEAREKIVGGGPSALEFLSRKAAKRDDWKTSLTAEMILLWIRDQRLCNHVTELMKGHIVTKVPAIPAGGEWSASRRAEEIAAYGQTVTPRVLELLTKTREYSSQNEWQALFNAITRLKDRRALPPLVKLMDSPERQEVKIAAAYTLGQLGDIRAVEILLTNLLNHSNGIELRKTCAISLGLLKDVRAIDPLLEVFRNEANEIVLRAKATSALGILGDVRAALPLAERLEKEQNVALLQEILWALADIGDRSCLPMIERVAKSHPDKFVRKDAEDARDSILRRER